MSRSFWVLALLALAAATGPGARREAAAQPASGSAGALRLAQPNAARFPEVTLYLYPTDPRGLLLGGLDVPSFRIRENDRPARILRVEARRGWLDVCLALDRSLSMAADDKIRYAKLAAAEFIRQLGPDDRAALIIFAEAAVLQQPLTRDCNALLQAVEQAEATGASTAFLDGVYWSIDQLALRPRNGGVLSAAGARADARRIVLALTDGNDLSSRTTAQQVIDYARANGVSLCTVALGQDADTLLLQHLARETGGSYLRAPAPVELQELYVRLARELRSEYRVTYRSPRPVADGTRREVEAAVPAFSLAARTWYQAPGQGSLLVTVPAEPSAPEPSLSSSRGARVDPALAIGLLLMLVGLLVALVALALWFRFREERLPIVDSNPRLDLLPLWVREGCTRVGRGPECELVLDSRKVSRVHARIEAVNGVYVLYDERSRNGTFVNGQRVRRSRVLRVGDVLRFGDREFRFAGELPSG